jgi:nucleoside-diphosphate-sugar epimerase
MDDSHRDIWRRVDLLDRRGLMREVAAFEPTHVLHLGARTDLVGGSAADYAANTIGVEHLLDSLTRTPCMQRALLASSRLVCEIGYRPRTDTDYRPTTAYGASKVEGERIVRQRSDVGFPWTIVRPTSIWGPWFGVPYRGFFEAVIAGRYVHPSGRRIRKSFGFVGNTVHQLESLLTANAGAVDRGTFYLADYPPLEVLDWAESIKAQVSDRRVRQAPLPLLRAAARLGDALSAVGWKAPPLTSFRLNNLLTEMVFDLDPLRELVGMPPFDLYHGVRETLTWLLPKRRQGVEPRDGDRAQE